MEVLLLAQYLVRKLSKGYEAAKFDDSSYPINVYKVTNTSCTCPSFRLCKHIKIIKEWQKMNQPIGVAFNDDASIIGRILV